MDDVISRQALLDKFEPWLKVKDYNDGELNMLKAILYEIRFVPPATDKLGTNLAEVGTDCISRQAAINKILGQPPEPHYPSWYAEQIKELPSAQPEIIRCKDCKHWIPYDWMFSEMWQSKNIADYPEDDIGCDCSEMAMKANDFCSRAERREVTE